MSEFDDWWQQRGQVVEAFNERRGGQSGVERVDHPVHGSVYIKRQTGHLFYSFRYPFGKPTIIRERDAYAAFKKAGLATPDLVFAEAQKQQGEWRAILVTKDLAGFTSLTDWYNAEGAARLGPEAHERFLKKLGETLGTLHKHRWCHGSLHFHHIYATPGSADQIPDIAFLDLERAQQTFTRKQAAKRDLKSLKRRRKGQIKGDAYITEAGWNILVSAHRSVLEK